MTARNQFRLIAASLAALLGATLPGNALELGRGAHSGVAILPAVEPGPHFFSASRTRIESASPFSEIHPDIAPRASLPSPETVAEAPGSATRQGIAVQTQSGATSAIAIQPELRTSPHLFSKSQPPASPAPFRLTRLNTPSESNRVTSTNLQAAAVQPVARPETPASNGGLEKLPHRQIPVGQSSNNLSLRAAAVQSVDPQLTTKLENRLPRLPGTVAPLQPAEVFSIARPDFFADEIELTGFASQWPQPAVLQPAIVMQSAEIRGSATNLPVPVAEAEPHMHLAGLQQPLPMPAAPLQPTEVLPIPNSPAAPRIPALDQDRPIAALTTSIAPTSGTLPQDYAVERFRGDYPPWAARGYGENVYFWDAPALCYGGLRYEEVNLERYGYGCCHVLQPFVSAAHFAGATLALPYNIVNRPPWECIYPLGHYRPGSPVPYRKIWPEWNPMAASAQCGAIAGLILLIP